MIIIRDRDKIILTLAAIVIVSLIGVRLLTGYLENRSQPALTDGVGSADVAGGETWTTNISREDRGGSLSEYRLERDRVRGKETTLLREIAGDAASTARAKEEAYAKLVELADREEKELRAEALIKAQGFADCAVIVNPSATMVMISGSPADTAGQERIRKSVSVATGITEKSVSVLQLSPGE
ncbi:MAG: SpoIIIAH-like family protein [Syntrophomonadaceae bacterium]